MTREFKLSDGREGTIDIDDMLVAIKGDEWAEDYIASHIAELESKITTSSD